MNVYEKWYAIEPIKGYVLKDDFVKIKTRLEMRINDGVNVNFIKKRDFIIVIFTSKKPIFVFYNTFHHIFKNSILKKAYNVKKLGNERTINHVDEIGLTIGIPY